MFLWVFFLVLAFSSPQSFARRGRILGHQSNFKGFNPCGWNTCRPHRASRPFGGMFRRFGSRGRFARMRNGFRRGPMMASPVPMGEAPAPQDSQSFPNQAPPEIAPQRNFDAHAGLPQNQPQNENDDLAAAPGFGPQSKEEPKDRVKLGQAIFEARCQKCHSEGGSQGPIEDFSSAIERVAKGEMPADKTPRITGEEFENLKAFLETKK